MTSRYIVSLAGFLLATTALASAATQHVHHHWKVVGRYVDTSCHCLSHPCGTRWMENGALHKCIAEGQLHRHRRQRS
jgi:hypothetical protein